VALTVTAVTILAIFAAYQWDNRVTTAVAGAALRQAIPLILGALCGLLCERSGVVNIGIEGTMLIAAFTSFMANVFLGNLWLALLVGLMTGVAMGGLLAVMSVTLKMDQIIGGTVLNMLAIGLTGYY